MPRRSRKAAEAGVLLSPNELRLVIAKADGENALPSGWLGSRATRAEIALQ